MDFQNTDLQGGSLQISTEVIGKIAGEYAETKPDTVRNVRGFRAGDH